MELDPAQLLPEDLLANILRRLPPSTLAASRFVRKAWCAAIDARRLLRADLLPLCFGGIFFMERFHVELPGFFSRPLTASGIGALDTDDPFDMEIRDHCNGLLLLAERVVNPATRQWARLPSYCPPPMEGFLQDTCLAYDPAVSPAHYEVFSIPFVPMRYARETEIDEGAEWPPSPFRVQAFSSRTGGWEPGGTIADMRSTTDAPRTVYWRGALYVHCQNNSVMRVTLSNDKYQMIKSPPTCGDFSLGKSEKGVYFGCKMETRFQVWLLNESCGQMDWVLKNDFSLQPIKTNFPCTIDGMYSRPWILHRVNDDEDVTEVPVTDKLEQDEADLKRELAKWDFDDGIILETEDTAHKYILFLGFHPFKEIAFFWVSETRVVSYHLNSSKAQDLGILRVPTIKKSFPYTPCWIDELSENN